MYQPYQYQNPYYQSNFQSYQNQVVPQIPQYSAQLAQPSLTGRTIGSHEEISAADVPQTGTPAYFPTQDGTVIFAKKWNPDGSITTLRYVPATDVQNEVQQPTLFDIVNQLNDIQDLLTAKPATKRTTKKVSDDDSE